MLEGVHLTLLIGPIVAVPVPSYVTDALQSVSVTVSSGAASGFQLTFSFSGSSPISRTLLPVGFFDPGIRVILIATIKGIPEVLMDGMITRQEITPSNTPGQSTLSITGEDLTVAMNLIDFTGFPYWCLPPEARVLLIIAKYALFGMVPLIIPSVLPEIPNPLEELPMHHGTDLGYIRELAANAGYVFYLIPGPVPGANLAYWGPEIRIGVPQPALNVNMDAHTNVETLSFAFDGLSREQPILFYYESHTHLTIPIPIPDISLLKPPLAARPAIPLRFKFLDGIGKLTPIQAALFGLAREAQGADAITGNGTLDVLRYGRVLKPRELVGVRGAGTAYDGVYYVKSVSHNIKRGEYKQSFSLAREGLISITPRVVP